ncbi:hypothetical protein QFC21_004734 [Naganishia friedmannii]|uniref:Uncharacterized protein n=1 Tax=Naganishia friedmannii TaxID=89922 RepID=A0ACC2VGJ8_9TREE|nr:hypothetical protein QFC21_004734 [Naganishia friedmannii]
MSVVKRYSTSTHLGSIFYYDGFTRNPHRWLTSGPQSLEPLCLYSLIVPVGKHDVGNTAAELVLNIVKSESEDEKDALVALRKKLFPGKFNADYFLASIRLLINNTSRLLDPHSRLPVVSHLRIQFRVSKRKDLPSLSSPPSPIQSHIPTSSYPLVSPSQPDESPYRSVMDDFLRREKATKSVLFGALHFRSSFLSPFRLTAHNPEFVSYEDPSYGAVSGLIEQRIRKLEDSVFPLDGLDSAALTF